MEKVRIPRSFSGLASVLRDGILFDVVIQVGGQEIQAHRVLLASASDALKAKFTTACRDASEKCWNPGVGSHEAWTWIVRWIYGCDDFLPWDLFTEILILADRFQVTDLLHALADLEPSGEAADALLPQLLGISSCPTVVDKLASKVIPASTPSRLRELLRGERLLEAPLENVALVVKHLPLVTHSIGKMKGMEEERLRCLGAILRARAPQEAFPECFVDAVHWELFPAEALEAGLAGDFRHFEQSFGSPMPQALTGKMSRALTKAIAARCRDLEARISHVAGPGLFSWMLEKQLSCSVTCSSLWNGGAHRLELFKLEKKYFRTEGEQRPSWIELEARDCLVKVEAVGLQHGHPDESRHRCQSFVVEAARGSGAWAELLSFGSRPLSEHNEVFAVEDARQGLFDRFRLRMTGPNTSAHWYLCLSWFDVFGNLQLKTAAELQEALLCDALKGRKRQRSEG